MSKWRAAAKAPVVERCGHAQCHVEFNHDGSVKAARCLVGAKRKSKPRSAMNRARKAVDHQREAVRAELHGIIDRAIDDWPTIDQWAALATAMGERPERRGSGSNDPTGTQVALLDDDPANQWLERFRAFRVEARMMDAARARLRPATKEEVRSHATSEAEPCARCGIPNPKMHRIDGQPFCAKAFVSHGLKGEACYYIEWRERRAAGANEQTSKRRERAGG